jgi:ABC-type molybdenum transport system ATPase subunit/photorepair protein PhrA
LSEPIKLERSETPLVADVEYDELTAEIVKPFDLAPEEHVGFFPFMLPAIPDDWGVGIIVGASGSGKSLLLREFGGESPVEWLPRRSIASHFDTAEQASERFYAVGLNSVPVWRLPYEVLSNGQKFRADLARRLVDAGVVDEYTSVVDRNVAVAASKAIRTWVSRSGVRRLVFASCHRDIIPWLRPDWTIDTDSGEFTLGFSEAQPTWWQNHIIVPETGVVGQIGLS